MNKQSHVVVLEQELLFNKRGKLYTIKKATHVNKGKTYPYKSKGKKK